MSAVSDLPNVVESVVFVGALLALIYVLVEALEAAPMLDFSTEVDDHMEDAYDHVTGWSNG